MARKTTLALAEKPQPAPLPTRLSDQDTAELQRLFGELQAFHLVIARLTAYARETNTTLEQVKLNLTAKYQLGEKDRLDLNGQITREPAPSGIPSVDKAIREGKP